MGKYLANERVAKEMAEAFESSVDECLEERLMRAIEAGRDTGGQVKGLQNAAALKVCDWDVLPLVDLRVDWDDGDAVAELRRLLEMYKPLIPFYSLRLKDPTIGGWREWLAKQNTVACDHAYFVT